MSEPSRGSASVPTLRFPRPQGNQRLANWISSSSPDIMAQAFFVEEDSAVDSYELINTDGETESQDGLTAGSIASSLDLLARPSDEDSLSGIDHIYEYEIYDANTHADEPRYHIEEVDPEEEDEEEELERTTTYEDVGDRSEPRLVNLAQPYEVHKGYLGGTIETIPFRASKAPETETDGQYHIVDRMRRSVQTPEFLYRARFVMVILTSLVFIAAFNMIGSAVTRPTANKACEQPVSGQVQQTLITTVAVKPPTTITTTVTTTLTAMPPAFSDIAKRLAASAEEVAKSVEKTCLPAALAFATKVRGEVAGWGKAHGLTGDALVKAHNELKDRFTLYLRAAEDSANDFKLNVLKAQIKSRLMWLHMRGEVTEYQRYQMQARDYLKAKYHQATMLRAMRDRRSASSTSRWGRSHLRHIFH